MAITVTSAAAKHIENSLAKRGSGVGLRLGVKKSGCSGMAYVIDYADSVADNDQVFESQGVKVIIDNDSLSYLDGTEVDFRREGLNQSFTFSNPNIKAACGCGESFTV
mgnify:CR=1 FL=1